MKQFKITLFHFTIVAFSVLEAQIPEPQMIQNISFQSANYRFSPEGSISTGLYVEHYDCTRPADSVIYSMHSVGECENLQEESQENHIKIKILQRNPLHEVPAVYCSVKITEERWWCGQYSHSSLDRTQFRGTHYMKLTGEQCKEAAENLCFYDTVTLKKTNKSTDGI